jgi:hypothetical protein
MHCARAGITWLLSEEVVAMGDAAWRARWAELAALAGARGGGNAAVDADARHLRPLHDWLEHQKALLALGAHHVSCSVHLHAFAPWLP